MNECLLLTCMAGYMGGKENSHLGNQHGICSECRWQLCMVGDLFHQ